VSVNNEPHLPGGATRVWEVASPHLPALVHPGWAEAYPWLIQGTTTRGPIDRSFDLGLFSEGSERRIVEANWDALGRAAGVTRIVHAPQPHEATVRVHRTPPPGLSVGAPCDGHVTDEADVLLAVTAADCVAVFAVDPRRRAIAVIHAGWRGVAAGVLERGLEVMIDDMGSAAPALHVHLGPAICGDCYEVGPEVFRSLGRPVPRRPTPIDLRAVLARRAVAAGVAPERISVSAHCTRCTASGLYSHRGGDRGRHAAYLGMHA
jgi:YfiH family protein